MFLSYRPHALGVLEKSCVEDTTTLTVKLMPKYPLRMDLVLRMFDTHNTFYTGKYKPHIYISLAVTNYILTLT